MTTKKHLLIGWLFILIWIVGIVYSLPSKETEAKKELSDTQICYGSGSTFEQQVTACGMVIKQAQYEYNLALEIQKDNANIASWAREKIRVVAKDFYDKNLSGTNVDFQ